MEFKQSKEQKGSIIVYTISVTSILIAITISIMTTFLPKLRASADAINSVTALYAADAGLEWCLYVNRGKPSPPPQPTFTDNGITLIIYEDRGSTSVSDCTESFLEHRVIGTSKGISRSFEVN